MITPSQSTYSSVANNLNYVLDREWFVRAVPGVAPSEPEYGLLGSSIFSVISDPCLRELLRVIFQKVYDHNEFVYLNYRCDTPELRRYCEMRVERRQTHEGPRVVVENRTVVARPRPAVRLLDGAQVRSAEILVMCSWCKKIHLEAEDWREVEESAERLGLMTCIRLPRLSHGLCPKCGDYLSKEARHP